MSANSEARVKPSVLLVDDDREFARAVALLLRHDFEIETVEDGDAALKAHARRAYDAVLLDIELPAGEDGLEILRRIRADDSQVPIFMVTRTEDPDVALRAGKLGATDYFTKGSPIETLSRRLIAALQGVVAAREREALERDPAVMRWQFVGESEAIRKLMAEADLVAPVDTTVLITGEHGTGKEVLARHLHRRSQRADQPFVAVNCAAIPDGTFESELFGHEEGAFTSAIARRRGQFELAAGGVLLLDEITEIPLDLQGKLLRVIQMGEFSRLGSERLQRVRARLICSTNRDPGTAIEEKRLRADLYYRINVVQLHIPPLRERPEDVPLLARHFLRAKSRMLGKPVDGFAPEVEALLLAHDWPGNARELENLIERAVVFCRSRTIGPELLSPISEGAAFMTLPWEEARELAMRRFERNYLTALLQIYSGSVARAARTMGVSRQAFYKALERADLNPEEFRRSRRTPPA